MIKIISNDTFTTLDKNSSCRPSSVSKKKPISLNLGRIGIGPEIIPPKRFGKMKLVFAGPARIVITSRLAIIWSWLS